MLQKITQPLCVMNTYLLCNRRFVEKDMGSMIILKGND